MWKIAAHNMRTMTQAMVFLKGLVEILKKLTTSTIQHPTIAEEQDVQIILAKMRAAATHFLLQITPVLA